MKTGKAFFILGLFFTAFVLLPHTVSAKDQWLQVRSKNFNLIGNATEKDIRGVATKLEQFRETFSQVFGQAQVNSPIPTNVVVFSSDSAYKPFKPRRADGKIDTFVAGFFQPGEDVNYITLSTENKSDAAFGIIFHEYVHFIVNTSYGKSEVPPWFNEGLAEYYQTFSIEEDRKVKLGLPQNAHLAMLKQNQFIPLKDLFKVSNFGLLQQEDNARRLFYAESWALVHYLLQNKKNDGLGKFLNAALKNVPQEDAFLDAFQISYAEMEKVLRTYISKNTYQYQLIQFPQKLVFDTEMQTSPLPEVETNAYLGDLLYHINRFDDAVPYLQTALAATPGLNMANTTLGMIRLRERKYEEAKTYLEKAIAGNDRNHLSLFRYAYLLSREGRDEFGYASSFPADKLAKIRELLKKAIAANPAFTESYELLAFTNLVNNEFLDESIDYLKTALRYQPGNQRYAMRLAEVFMRLHRYDEAGAIAEKIAKTSDDLDTKTRAEIILADMVRRTEAAERSAREKKAFEEGRGPLSYGSVPASQRRVSGGKTLTPEEIAKAQEEAVMRSLNMAIGKLAAGEMQVIGTVQKIECRRGITYTVKTAADTFTLTSRDFQELRLRAFVFGGDRVQIGCGENVSSFNAVLRYRPTADPKRLSRGELVGVTFVPKNFRFIDLSVPQDPPPPGPTIVEAVQNEAVDAQSRAAMLQLIKDSLQKPAAGEKQRMGFIEKSECTSDGSLYFYMKTVDGLLKLTRFSQEKLHIRGFTPDIENVEFGCNMKALDIPVVFIYTDAPNSKSGTAGEITSLEIVPKSFIFN